jgi:hypothetical protein
MNDPRLVFLPREDATAEGERAALAAVYAFVLECHKQKGMVAEDGDTEDGTEDGHGGGSPEERRNKDGSA